MENYFDALIVGSGTSGTYLSFKLAKSNFKVLVIDKDKEEDICNRFDIIHFQYDDFLKHGLALPKEGDPDMVEIFHDVYTRSALDKNEKRNSINVYAAHFHMLFERLKGEAIKAGARFSFNTSYKEIIYNTQGNPIGIKAIKDSKPIEYYAGLIVDATGMSSSLRRDIKSQYMENFSITPLDRFYVTLSYVKWKDGTKTLTSTSYPYFKSWIAPCSFESGGIIGTGAVSSIAHAKEKQKHFLERIKVKDFELIKEEGGSTPYSRSPYSFISDNFLIIGDTALLTNPMSGEGMSYTLEFIDMALPTLKKALKENDFSALNLWPININYNRDKASIDSLIRSGIISVLAMSEEENDYLFEKNIIFKSDSDTEPNMIKELISGLFKGKISFKSFKLVLRQFSNGKKIFNHYKKFPSDISKYHKWVNKSNKIWKKIGHISYYDK